MNTGACQYYGAFVASPSPGRAGGALRGETEAPQAHQLKCQISKAFETIYSVRLRVFKLKFGLKFLVSALQSGGLCTLFAGGIMVLNERTEIGIVVAFFISGAGPGSELEGARKDRPPHVDVEAKPAFTSRNIEIEAAIAEVQVPRRAEGIIDRAEHLPIGMRADPKAANIAIRGQTPAVAEVPVITRTDQRIGPATGGRYRCCRQESRVQAQVRREPPGAEPEAGIDKLHRVLEETV
jgi:hypothetical protein